MSWGRQCNKKRLNTLKTNLICATPSTRLGRSVCIPRTCIQTSVHQCDSGEALINSYPILSHPPPISLNTHTHTKTQLRESHNSAAACQQKSCIHLSASVSLRGQSHTHTHVHIPVCTCLYLLLLVMCLFLPNATLCAVTRAPSAHPFLPLSFARKEQVRRCF